MNSKNEILDYIISKENNGALLVTGKWGCGKSYLIKDIIKKINKENKMAMAIVSLFGISDIPMLNYRIKEEYLELNSSFIGKTARKLYKVLGKAAKEGAAVISAAAPDSVAASAVSTGITSISSFNPFDFISVKNTVGTGEKERPFVLVLDDLERCNISIVDLLGAINDYSENKIIKTIVIADQDKIQADKYKEFKEKIIFRTVKLAPNYSDIIDSIISNYQEIQPGYINFLKSNKELILKVFIESDLENLRSLRACLVDFERVFKVWNKTGVSKEFLVPVFYMFAAIMFETKSGNYKENKYGYLFADAEAQKKYTDWKGTYLLYSLKSWIVEGSWNEEEIIDEIKSKYNVVSMPSDKKFLAYHFWDLEQQYITEGMPIAVEDAYKGLLTRDELISLLQKIHAFRIHNIPLPCNIDYPKMMEGFQQRKSKIFSGKIIEPKRRTFSEKKQLDEEAYLLYDVLETFDSELVLQENKTIYIDFLTGKSKKQGYSMKGLPIGDLDDELLNLFLAKYYSIDNHKKRELALTLTDLGFKDTCYMSNIQREETVKNLNELKKRLSENTSILTDYISKAINNSFIEKIEELIVEIEDIIKERND